MIGWAGTSIVWFLMACGGSRDAQTARRERRNPVLLLSVDGLRPDHILQADKYGLAVPNFRRFLKEGSYATGVRGVLPSVTFPSETTILTGVSPRKHGVLANTTFDPLEKNREGWFWYAKDIQVPTLWDAATKQGLVTGNLYWPVSVGANVTYNVVHYWRSATPDDRKLTRALSTPGLVEEMEKALGPYPYGDDWSLPADEQRARFARYLIEKKKPAFMTFYFASLDAEEHLSGPFRRETFNVLEHLDTLIGELRDAAERVSQGRGVISVVSDHGFANYDKEINIRALMHDAGFFELDEKQTITSWRAVPWLAGGSAAIMIKDPQDEDTKQRVRQLFARYMEEPSGWVQRIWSGQEAGRVGGFPDATWVIELKADYKFGRRFQGPWLLPGKRGGTHGYFPDNPEMNSAFFLVGPGVPEARSVGIIDLRDIAPTLAGFLGVSLPQAEGRRVVAASR